MKKFLALTGAILSLNSPSISQSIEVEKPYKDYLDSREISEIRYRPLARHFFNDKNHSDGLPTVLNIFHAMEDRKGYTWFSTANGVTRYDGHRFKNYSVEDGLPDITIFKSYEDPLGKIWFISYPGILSYYEDGAIKPYQHNDVVSPMLNKDKLASIYIDSLDNLHLGLYGRGYIKVSPDGNVEEVITKDSLHTGIGLVLLEDSIPFVFYVGNRNMSKWERGQVTLYSSLLEKVDTFNIWGDGPIDLQSKHVKFIQLQNGQFLVSYNKIAAVFEPGTPPKRYSFPSNIISLFEDSYNGIWVGMSNKGVAHFVNGISSTLPRTTYYPNFSVTSIEEDREGGIWLTTIEKAIYHIPTPSISRFDLEHAFADKYKNFDSFVYKDSCDGNIYVLTNRGELFYSDSSSIYALDLKKVFPENDQLYTFSLSCNTERKEVMIGGYKNIYKKNDRGILSISETAECPIDGPVYHMTCFNDSITWGSTNKTLFKLENGHITFCTSAMNSYISGIQRSQDNGLWITCRNGLWKYKNDKLSYWGEKDSLLSTSILSLYEFGGSLWLNSTKLGLLRKPLHGKTEVFTYNNKAFRYANGFMENSGMLWFLSKYALNQIIISNDSSNSFIVNTIPLGKSFAGSSMSFMTQWNDQISVIGAGEILQFNRPPDFNINEELIPHIEQIKINDRDTSLLPSYDLGYKQNHIAITYIGISNRSQGDMVYKYRIEGIDPNWLYTAERQVQYPFMPEGNYKFEVYAKGINNVWSENPAVVLFSISPPYWKTWWFITVMVLGAISFITLIIRYRFLQVQRESKMQLALNESKQHALSARMNPHFIFNSLNSIKTYVLENDAKASNDFIARFAKLMRQILDQSQFTLIPLSEELKALENYLSLETMRTKERFTYAITVSPSIDSDRAKVPSLLLQPFVENAIWHGIMPKNSPGTLRITLLPVNNHIECVIEDDGVGRAISEGNKENLNAHQSSAMKIANQRLKLINARYGTNIRVEIIDLKDKNEQATGTRVIIPIPKQL